jgi:hypothetical protein
LPKRQPLTDVLGEHSTNKKIFNIFLVISFCFTAALVGADDNWYPAVSANDLIGKWEGNITIDIPENNFAEMMLKSSMCFRVIFEYSKNTGMWDKDNSFFMNINFDKFLDDLMKSPELKTLGISKDDVWDIFAVAFSSMDELSDYNVVVKKYHFEYSYNIIIDELINDGDQGQILLNKDKSQMDFFSGTFVKFWK